VLKEGKDVFNRFPLVCSLIEPEGRTGDGIPLEALVQSVMDCTAPMEMLARDCRN
jgi:hypothetical protein